MVAGLWLQVEVAGCPTVCRHCWAQGVPYPAMPLADVAWVLERVHRFCDDHDLGFGAYPMHEVAAHPEAAALLRLFADHVGAAEFEPLSSTGVPLALREDWRELLAAAASLGTTTVWVAFHGLDAEHDRQVNRSGAFTETCLAIRRVHAAGLRAGANVFVTGANAANGGRLLEALQRLRVEETSWEPATFYPTPRGRRNERLRPEPADLLPLADRIRRLSPFHADAWADPEAYAEAAWVGRALSGAWPTPEPTPAAQGLPLVCRPTLDVHTGAAGRYRDHHGNLRTDDPHAVLDRALDQGARSLDSIWFGPAPLPTVDTLATHHGDPSGPGVHFTADSVRYLWLDRSRLEAAGQVR
jgi:hypothetical protein